MGKKSRGKKKQKAASQMRPGLWVDMGRRVEVSSVRFDGKSVSFIGANGEVLNPVAARVEITGQAEGGKERPVHHRGIDPQRLEVTPPQRDGRYAKFLAVDTNTMHYGGRVISVAYAMLYFWDKTLRYLNILDMGALEFHDSPEAPERVGWCAFIQEALKLTKPPPGLLAVVADHDINSHAAMNARERPILRDFFVPEGVEFNYASSDRGKSQFLENKFLAMCDSKAKAYMSEVKRYHATTPFPPIRPGLFCGVGFWRRWRPNGTKVTQPPAESKELATPPGAPLSAN